MRGFLLCVLVFAFAFAKEKDFSNIFGETELLKNVPMNGTIAKGETLSFIIRDVSDWRYVAFGVQLSIPGKKDLLLPVGSAKISCDKEVMEFPLENFIPSTRYHDPVFCDDKPTHITIMNNQEEEADYWLIVADIDSAMYDIPDNSPYYNVLPGHSTYEFVTYRTYIGKDTPGSGAVDFVNITVNYDTFSDTKIKAFFADGPRPDDKQRQDLTDNGNGLLIATLSRTDKLFCQDCYRYLTVMVENPKDKPVFFNVKWAVDRNIIILKNNEMYTGTVISDNHGQHFIIDLTNEEYDVDIYIGTAKLDNPDDDVTFDVALTSFDDGEWDTCKTVVNKGVGLREWGIRRDSPCFRVGGILYVRAWTANEVVKPNTFTIVYRLNRVNAPYLYKGKKASYVTRQDLESISYYFIKVPKEEFVDVRSLTITMTDIRYTCTGSFCYGFDAFYGKAATRVLPINPKDPSTYSYTSSVSYRRERSFTITEDQEGWCTDCLFAFAIRTSHETEWNIQADLGFSPFLLQPNQPRTGTLKGFTGGIESFLYLHQTEYRPIEISATRVSEYHPNVVLYVSTKPHPDESNHFWRDTTDADGKADVILSNDYPWYCTDCYYYISIYFMDTEAETDSTLISLQYSCPDGVCKSCEEGFDPAYDCKACLPGYFGATCQRCSNCNHGKCDDGMSGTGKCICDMGWGPEETCNTCVSGYYGDECTKCPFCHNHGKCNDGIQGDGQCVCENHWDPRVDCEDCAAGYFGATCEGECPRTEAGICDNHGECDDKDTGSGHCTCMHGMVGIKCDTKITEDKCTPHCYPGHGACDEEKGVCECWYNYKGADCNKQLSNIWIMVTIVLFIIIILISVVIVIKKIVTVAPSRKRTRKSSDKKPLTENTENLYSGLN